MIRTRDPVFVSRLISFLNQILDFRGRLGITWNRLCQSWHCMVNEIVVRSFGMVIPEVKHFVEALVAATCIVERINRTSKINTDDPNRLILDNIPSRGTWLNLRASNSVIHSDLSRRPLGFEA